MFVGTCHSKDNNLINSEQTTTKRGACCQIRCNEYLETTVVCTSIGGVTSCGDGIPDAALCERYISHEMGQLRRGSDSYVTVTPDRRTDTTQCYVSRLYHRKLLLPRSHICLSCSLYLRTYYHAHDRR